MNSTLTYGTGLNSTRLSSTVTTPAMTGATASSLLRAGAPASAHPSAATSCAAAPVMSGVRLREEIGGTAFGLAPANVAGAGGIHTGVSPVGVAPLANPETDAQLRASVRWSDDL